MPNTVHIGNIVFNILPGNELVVSVGSRKVDALTTKVDADSPDDGKQISNFNAISYLGILSWDYLCSDGSIVVPTASREHSNEFSSEVYTDVFRQAPKNDDDVRLQQSIAAAARRSTIVKTWAKEIDFEALHAFDGLLSGTYLLDAYKWITQDNISSKAVRRFALSFPLLAEAVCHGPEMFDLATSASDLDDAYRLIIEHVLRKGLPCTASNCENAIKSLPLHLLNSLYQLKLDSVESYDPYDTMREISIALNFARDLPENSFPRDSHSFNKFSKLAQIISRMRRIVYDHMVEEFDFSMNLSNEELAEMLAPQIANRFADCPDLDVWSASSSLIHYGITLTGNSRKLIDYLDGRETSLNIETIDSSPLKNAFIKEGFIAVYEKAQTYLQAEAEFIEMAGPDVVAPSFALQ